MNSWSSGLCRNLELYENYIDVILTLQSSHSPLICSNEEKNSQLTIWKLLHIIKITLLRKKTLSIERYSFFIFLFFFKSPGLLSGFSSLGVYKAFSEDIRGQTQDPIWNTGLSRVEAPGRCVQRAWWWLVCRNMATRSSFLYILLKSSLFSTWRLQK